MRIFIIPDISDKLNLKVIKKKKLPVFTLVCTTSSDNLFDEFKVEIQNKKRPY